MHNLVNRWRSFNLSVFVYNKALHSFLCKGLKVEQEGFKSGKPTKVDKSHSSFRQTNTER